VALVAPGAVLFVAFGVPAAILDEVNTDTGVGQVVLASTAQLLGLTAAFLYYGYCEEIVRQSNAGIEVSVAEALVATAHVLPRLIAGSIVTSVAIAAGLLLLIVPGVWLLMRWALVTQVISFERATVGRSIRRSTGLTRGHGRLVLSTVVLAIVLSGAGAGAAQELGRALAANDTLGRIVAAGAGQMLAGPFTGVVVATVYFRLLAAERSRHL
jgi:hypothetical protein